MKKILILLLFTASVISCNNASNQEVKVTSGEPDGPHTSTEWKIWAYSTAAPSFIAK